MPVYVCDTDFSKKEVATALSEMWFNRALAGGEQHLRNQGSDSSETRQNSTDWNKSLSAFGVSCHPPNHETLKEGQMFWLAVPPDVPMDMKVQPRCSCQLGVVRRSDGYLSKDKE